jgi:hypothetical protein
MHVRRILLGSVFCVCALTALGPMAHAPERDAPPVREARGRCREPTR